MKTRTGFVSNSSSSSFVLIIPTADFEKELELHDELDKFIANEIFTSDKFLGTDIKILHQQIDRGGNSNIDYDDLAYMWNSEINQNNEETEKDETEEEDNEKIKDKAYNLIDLLSELPNTIKIDSEI